MQSMTGFGKSDAIINGQIFSIEVKSVNHRYLDLRFRMPPILSSMELALSEILRAHFERGAFEINIKQKISPTANSQVSGTRFIVDESALKTLLTGCELLASKYGITDKPSLDFCMNSGKVFVVSEDTTESVQLSESLKELFLKAVLDLKKMRQNEGARLKDILEAGVRELINGSEQLALLAPLQAKKTKERLDARLAQWKLSTPVDPQRLELEVAILADKSDISEEIDRLKTHTKEFLTLLGTSKPVGRKLDFMTQELHREVNTSAAKTSQIEITQLAVNLKTQIEKLREQVQNVE